MARKRSDEELELDLEYPAQPRSRGRFFNALSVLLGQKTTPIQVEAEWVEYKAIFSDLLSRHSAMLARHAKAEKERIDRQLGAMQVAPEPQLPLGNASGSRKAQLRSMVAGNIFPGLAARMPAPPMQEE